VVANLQLSVKTVDMEMFDHKFVPTSIRYKMGNMTLQKVTYFQTFCIIYILFVFVGPNARYGKLKYSDTASFLIKCSMYS
jgi:hypothetical protein